MDSLELKDYVECREKLVGKLVLLESGSIHSTSRRVITKIIKATKSFISLADCPESKFSWNGGKKGGGTGRSSWGSHSSFELISEEKAEELRQEWKKKRLTKEMLETITEKLSSLSFEQLEQISKIINPK